MGSMAREWRRQSIRRKFDLIKPTVLALFACFAMPLSAETFEGRSLIITDGRNDPARSAPVILALHGFLGNAANMQAKTGFDTLARRNGLIVVYPNGKRRRWNDGRSNRMRSDDVGYLAGLIEALIADGRADPKRIFLAGHSNGGGMAMRMACDRPDLVTGISVAATKVPMRYQCADGQPVPAIFFFGSVDPISPPEGRPRGSRLGAALSAEASIGLWARRNRCQSAPRVQTVDRLDDGTSARIARYPCAAPLARIEIEGHGHDWPSRTGRATRLQGPASREIDASAMSWRFFQSL